MGDANPIRTLGDYSKPSHEGYRNTIKLLVGNNVVPLRSDTIQLVQNGCSFHRLRSEDPNQHLKDFLKLVDSLDLDGENKEITRLCLFQFSLCDQASNWLELAGDDVTSIKRRRRDRSSDGVRILATTSGRGRLKKDLESSTWRRRQKFCLDIEDTSRGNAGVERDTIVCLVIYAYFLNLLKLSSIEADLYINLFEYREIKAFSSKILCLLSNRIVLLSNMSSAANMNDLIAFTK
ncbi:hypothetical protein Tco_0078571 [Tanacetum coccineum]